MAMQELSEHYQKSATQIGASSLIPYLVLVVIKAFKMQYQHGITPKPDKRLDGFKIRLVLCEYFTAVQHSMS